MVVTQYVPWRRSQNTDASVWLNVKYAQATTAEPVYVRAAANYDVSHIAKLLPRTSHGRIAFMRGPEE